MPVEPWSNFKKSAACASDYFKDMFFLPLARNVLQRCGPFHVRFRG